MFNINNKNIQNIKKSSDALCKENLSTHIVITVVITLLTMIFEKLLNIDHHYKVYPVSQEAIFFMFQHFIMAFIVTTSMRNHHLSAKEVFLEFKSRFREITLTGLVISILSYVLLLSIYHLSKILNLLLYLITSAFDMTYLNNMIEFTVITGSYLVSIVIYTLVPIISACILSKDADHELNVLGVFRECFLLIERKLIKYVFYFISSRLIIFSGLKFLLDYISTDSSFVIELVLSAPITMLEILAEIYILNFFMYIGDKHMTDISIETIKEYTHSKTELSSIFKKNYKKIGLKALYISLIYIVIFATLKYIIFLFLKVDVLFKDILSVILDVIEFGLILRATHKTIKNPNDSIKDILIMNKKSVLYILPVSIFVAVLSLLVFKPIFILSTNKVMNFDFMLASPIFMIIAVLLWLVIAISVIISLEVVIISIYGMEIDRHENLNPITELLRSSKGLSGYKTRFLKFMFITTIDIIIVIMFLEYVSLYMANGWLIPVIDSLQFIAKAEFISKLAICILVFAPRRLDRYVNKENQILFE